jgi:hypothetical protein
MGGADEATVMRRWQPSQAIGWADLNPSAGYPPRQSKRQPETRPSGVRSEQDPSPSQSRALPPRRRDGNCGGSGNIGVEFLELELCQTITLSFRLSERLKPPMLGEKCTF